MPAPVKLYSTPYCPYCIRAKQLLDHKRVPYTDIDVAGDPTLRNEMMVLSGRHTVPQIWIGEQHVGGYDDLALLEHQGRLDELLQGAASA